MRKIPVVWIRLLFTTKITKKMKLEQGYSDMLSL